MNYQLNSKLSKSANVVRYAQLVFAGTISITYLFFTPPKNQKHGGWYSKGIVVVKFFNNSKINRLICNEIFTEAIVPKRSLFISKGSFSLKKPPKTYLDGLLLLPHPEASGRQFGIISTHGKTTDRTETGEQTCEAIGVQTPAKRPYVAEMWPFCSPASIFHLFGFNLPTFLKNGYPFKGWSKIVITVWQ